jgi:hypothetical protein
VFAFIQKHWKGFLITLGVIGAFISGILAGGSARGRNSTNSSTDYGVTPGHKAALVEVERVTQENVNKLRDQNKLIAEDNRLASGEIDGIRQDNNRLESLADEIERLARSGGN